jgi:hypothetical protein
MGAGVDLSTTLFRLRPRDRVSATQDQPRLPRRTAEITAAGNQAPRDRTMSALLCFALSVWFVLMALDARRLEWSSVPTWVEVIGVVLIGTILYARNEVLRENPFGVTNVRLQPERGQTVVPPDVSGCGWYLHWHASSAWVFVATPRDLRVHAPVGAARTRRGGHPG